MLRTSAMFVLVLAFLPSCKSDTKTVGRSIADVAGFCAEWAERACSDAVIDACASSSDTVCQGAQADFCEKLIPDGKYTTDLLGAQECLDAVLVAYKDATLTPDERAAVLHLQGPCNKVLSGSTGRGGKCIEDSDCDRTKELTCVKKGAVEGSCEEAVETENGGDCSEDEAVCKAGAYCDRAVLACINGKKQGLTCSAATPCGAGLRCADDTGATVPVSSDAEGKCVALGATGDDCNVDGECVSGVCTPKSGGGGICSTKTTLTPGEAVCANFQ